LGKAFAVAFAVRLDVFAISVAVGVARLPFDASLRLGVAFAGSEIAMQAIGYALGVGAGKMLGVVRLHGLSAASLHRVRDDSKILSARFGI
jgi:putative Mn2+ efflux pump MntP